MKTTAFIAFMFLWCCVITAQTERGKVLVGGGSNLNAYFSSERNESSTSTLKYNHSGFNLDLKVGYFLVKNLALGEYNSVDYYCYKNVDNDSKNQYTDVSVGPFIRYYFGQSKVKPFAHTQIGWVWSNSKYITVSGTTKNKYTGPEFGIGFGVAIFVNDRVGLTGMLAYNGRSIVDVDDSANKSLSNQVNFNMGITVSL